MKESVKENWFERRRKIKKHSSFMSAKMIIYRKKSGVFIWQQRISKKQTRISDLAIEGLTLCLNVDGEAFRKISGRVAMLRSGGFCKRLKH